MTGWPSKKLGDVVRLEYGKGLPESDRAANGAHPVYGANGVKGRSNSWLAEGPSLIVGRKGTAGAITRVDGKFWPLDVTYYVTFDPQIADRDFLYYALGQLNLPSLARGVKPGINRDDVYRQMILLPTLNEQKRVVGKLEAIERERAQFLRILDRQRDLIDDLWSASRTSLLGGER